MSNTNDQSVGERVLTSTLWVGSWRWTARLIGLATTIILARLLLPDDFGVVATGGLVVAFFDILIDLGTDNYLIRLSDPTREDYDTAWTLRLSVIAAASAVTFLAAVPVTNFFDDHRLMDVIRVLALANIMRGFTNIGLTMYRRELEYKKIALVGLGKRLVGAVTTVSLALVLRSYWAMVFGAMALYAAELVLSYLIHPYRPRPTFVRFREQWDFSQWIVVRNLAVFLQGQGDQIIVAKYFGIEQIGFYSMAMRFAALPTSQLIAPMQNPVYSGLAKKRDPVHFNRGLQQIIGATSAVVLPAATLLATLSDPFVLAVLGPKWLSTAPLIAPLVFAAGFAALTQPAVSALTLVGRVRLLAVFHWVGAISVISVTLIVGYLGNIQQLAFARAGLALALLISYYVWVAVSLAVPWTRLLGCTYRPVIASLVMAFVTASIASISCGPMLKIAIAIVAGALIYPVSLYGLWRAASSPESGEALIVRKASVVLARALKRFRM